MLLIIILPSAQKFRTLNYGAIRWSRLVDRSVQTFRLARSAAVPEAAGRVVPRAVAARRAPVGVGRRAALAAHAVLAARARGAHGLPHGRHAGALFVSSDVCRCAVRSCRSRPAPSNGYGFKIQLL